MMLLQPPGAAGPGMATPRGIGRMALLNCSVSVPKRQRKGAEFQFKLELAEPDSRGESKYIIATSSEADCKVDPSQT